MLFHKQYLRKSWWHLNRSWSTMDISVTLLNLERNQMFLGRTFINKDQWKRLMLLMTNQPRNTHIRNRNILQSLYLVIKSSAQMTFHTTCFILSFQISRTETLVCTRRVRVLTGPILSCQTWMSWLTTIKCVYSFTWIYKLTDFSNTESYKLFFFVNNSFWISFAWCGDEDTVNDKFNYWGQTN